ncbi:uncharacterized protein LOC124813378 isoform X2 [Hydra vulgaris]|uniref:Uncharacterized protein LOC124813378 isoform X2 n=2 Tax=Hydra vulgaris TaxID=6087 RepID=A0ABM4CWU9_HYDVU
MNFPIFMYYTLLISGQWKLVKNNMDIGKERVQRCGDRAQRILSPRDIQQIKDLFTKRYTGKLSFMGEYPIGLTACQLDPLPPFQNMYGWVPVAVSPKDFISSIMCGSCLKISPRYEIKRSRFSYDADKTYFATVVDECLHCNIGDIRMYKDGDGIHDVIYEAIECPPLTGSNGMLRVKISNCANKNGRTEIQLKNTRLPIVAIELFQDEAWNCLDRTSNNFYRLPNNNFNSFPIKARATSITGELLGFTIENSTEQIIPAQFLSMYSMNQNFSPKLKCFVPLEENSDQMPEDFLSNVPTYKNPNERKKIYKGLKSLIGKFAQTNLSTEAVLKLMEKSSSKEIEIQSDKEKTNENKTFPRKNFLTSSTIPLKEINQSHLKKHPLLNSSYCSHRIDGQYPYPDDCYSFVICTNGSPIIKVCPAGLLFNSEETVCDWPANVKCIEGEFVKKLQLLSDEDIFTKKFFGKK